MNQSRSCSIEDNSQLSETRPTSLKRQISSISIKSISEFSEDKDSSNRNYNETFESDTSNKYSESFETTSSADLNDTKVKYSETFESVTSDLNESKASISDDFLLKELKETDYINYIKTKIKLQQQVIKKPQLKYHKKQIDKLINRANEWSKDQITVKEEKNLINPQIIVKLKSKNLIKEFREDQLKKIEKFGENIKSDAPVTEDQIQRIYYKTKCNQIKYKSTKNEFETNETNYCDGIIKIGILARDLPKLTDDPHEIWNQLLKPLNDLKINKVNSKNFY